MKTAATGKSTLEISATDAGYGKRVDIEQLLEAAGIEFTVVGRCPHPECEICDHPRLQTAA